MLIEALRARLPLLRATTTDTVNLADVLQHLVPEHNSVVEYNKSLLKGDVFFATEQVIVTESLYRQLVDSGKTLILINQDDDSGITLNVGEVPVPADMMRDLLQHVAGKKSVDALLPAFRGLTLKSASEVIRLVKTIDKELTVEAVLRERSKIVGKLKGLSLVDTRAVCYLPNLNLQSWVKGEKSYFHGATDPRLIPRGLLFDGIPGTGKTQGAKYIAREFGVSLYRLDMGSVLGKWVGESEASFSRVLSALDQEEPCVFLIDEVEKLFESGSEDAGVTSRILSQLLWWLQEHTSRILTVMTTNKREALPPELYRVGRIDYTIEFEPMKAKEAKELVASLCTSFGIEMPKTLALSVTKEATLERGITPANVTQMVYGFLKKTGKGLS